MFESKNRTFKTEKNQKFKIGPLMRTCVTLIQDNILARQSQI